MKLIIKRDQDKAFLGGINFKLFCQVELTPNEKELVRKYKLDNEILTTRADGMLAGAEKELITSYVNSFQISEEIIQDIVDVIAVKNDFSIFG
jgi:hypothetical protein